MRIYADFTKPFFNLPLSSLFLIYSFSAASVIFQRFPVRNAFIFFSVGRYDVKGKQLLKTLGKNYIIDMGFRNMLLGYRDADRGHIIENIVFLELIRRDYRVYIGKFGETEIDFVAEKPNDKLYIQVTESMLSPETRERELRPLRMIPDNYEKIVLSMDRDYITSYDGIKSLYLIDWLLS